MLAGMVLTDHADIIAALGGGTKLSRGLQEVGRPVKRKTVYGWSLRGSIPDEYWTDIVEVARRASVTEITLELLANMARRGAINQAAERAA
jgi:hypothetical protein